MENNQHTPGPWSLFDGKSSSMNKWQFVMANDKPADWRTLDGKPDTALCGRVIADVHENTEKFGEWTPNARLIAAAPDLLDALQKALEELEYIDSHCGVKNEHGEWIDIDQKAIRRAYSAIRKAKGE